MADLIRFLWNSRITTLWRSFLDRKIVESAISLYGAQAVNYAIPLLTIPYLARVLGPETWGTVMFIQAIGLYLLLVVEYSFDLSATREVAKHRDDKETLAQLVSGVLGARTLLTAAVVLLISLAYLTIPSIRDLGWLLWLGAATYIVMAMRPFWFFLGLERVRVVVTIEICLRFLSVFGVFLFVKAPGDAWMVFALQGGAAGVALLFTMSLMYRIVRFRVPTVLKSIYALRQGIDLFVFRASTSVYDMSNTLILGLLTTPASVAYYASAERILRLLYGAISPITQAMYPRASSLARTDPFLAARMARVTTLTLFSLTLVGSVALYFLAPWVIRILLGVGYDQVVPVIRILLIVLIINSISIPLGNHWLIPAGHERFLTKVTVLGGMMHIPVAIYLGYRFAHIGISWAYVFTEAFILAVLVIVPLVRELGPFRLRVRSDEAKAGAAQSGGWN